MKRYSLGLFAFMAAILLVAFTNAKPSERKFEDFYWFNVPGSIANTSTLTNSDVSYLGAHQPSDPSPASCTGSINYCHVGFRDNQVTVNGASVTVNGTQTPAAFDSKQ